MTAEPTLDEVVLLATREALEVHDPHLSSHVDTILSQTPSPPSFRPGTPAHPKYLMTLSKEPVDLIVAALKRIEDQQGFDAVYGDRQINFLVSQWSRLAQSVQ